MKRESLRVATENAIRNRIKRSKKIGRGLAAVSVAAGIALGVSSEKDDAAIIASTGAGLASMGAGVRTGASTQRRCRRLVDDYRRSVNPDVLSAEAGEDVGSSQNVVKAAGRFAVRKFDKAVLPINGALQPMITYYGAAQISNYAKYGGNILPSGLPVGSESFDTGVAFGAVMLIGGGLMLNSGISYSEQHYFNQLDKIDGQTPDEQAVMA
jgi:hypothetical protein